MHRKYYKLRILDSLILLVSYFCDRKVLFRSEKPIRKLQIRAVLFSQKDTIGREFHISQP